MNILPGQKVSALRTTGQATAEQTEITVLADTGARESSTLTCDTGGNSVQADFFVITNVAGTTFGVWLDIDANGTAPDGAIYTATDTKIEVDIASSDTAAQVATKVFTAVDGNVTNVSFTDNSDGTITIAQDNIGAVDDVAVYDETEAGSSSLSVTTNTAGADSNIQNTYFQATTPGGSNFYVWCNVGTEGSDPSGTGTGIEAACTLGGTASTIAGELATAINGNANFVAESDGDKVLVTNAATGDATDVADNNTNFTFKVGVEGQGASFWPGTSVGSLTTQPSNISELS